MRFIADVSGGGWIAPRLSGWAVVGSTVPRGFAAYARVFHPVSLSVFVDWPERRRELRPATWASIAAALGTEAHPGMQWDAITRGTHDSTWIDGWEVDPPRTGDLAPESLALLAGLLPDGACTVGVWAGWGGLHGGVRVTFAREGSGVAPSTSTGPFGVDPAITRATSEGPLLELPGREYVLLAGRVEELRDVGWAAAAGLGEPGSTEPVNLIWPDDRSWFVATEIDYDSTIVGGSEQLISAVLSADGLEAARVEVDTDLSSAGDTRNPAVPT